MLVKFMELWDFRMAFIWIIIFFKDIRLLLGTEWKSEIEKCKRIFIRVPSYHKSVLISSNSTNTSNQNSPPFTKDDLRLRNIPFMTFRPTFNEVKRTHSILSKLEHFGIFKVLFYFCKIKSSFGIMRVPERIWNLAKPIFLWLQPNFWGF